MANFVQLNEDNEVIWSTFVDNDILIDENGVEQESLGIQHIHDTIPGSENYVWKQTSYNSNFRGTFASIGFIYHEKSDKFVSPCKYNSWVLNDSGFWEPPIPEPESSVDGDVITRYEWNEESLSWDPVLLTKPYPSWTFNEVAMDWIPPVENPPFEYGQGGYWSWDENDLSWKIVPF